jgi:hypothetical protein
MVMEGAADHPTVRLARGIIVSIGRLAYVSATPA